MQILILLGIAILVWLRVYQAFQTETKSPFVGAGCSEHLGDQQLQADCAEVVKTSAGLLAVLADGIGKEKRGVVAAHTVIDSTVSLFEEYQVMPNPVYFLKRSFYLANHRILKALDGRMGGASMACVLLDQETLYYAIAGNIQIALYRKDSLIPLSEGQTLGKLAEQSYKKGQLSRQKALSAVKEQRLYNYLGQDDFRELELFDIAVKLKKNDRIVLMTKGIYEALPWQTLELLLADPTTSPQQQADQIIKQFAELKEVERDNGSVIIISA